MRAVLVERLSGPEDLAVSELPAPTPGPGELVVRVRAAAVNFFDSLIIAGRYQEKPPLPFVPGGEIAGEVERLGPGVSAPAVGARVFARIGWGGFAEQVVVDAGRVYPVPPGMGFEQAAALPIVYGSAYGALVTRGALRPGERVVVTAAAGGVGLAAVQLGSALGARVVGLASGEKLGAVRAAGAEAAIDYRAPGWEDALGAALGGAGADLVVENVGGEVFEGCMKHLAFGARLVVVGFASGKIPEVKLNRVLLKHVSLVGLHLGPMLERDPQGARALFAELAALAAAGRIRPEVTRTLPLERAAEAVAAVAGRSSTGKIVLVP